ncbi:superoxide dismutase family protein [Streptomyces sp. NPDC006700]|uniref:superoxide dismutase family protein n=1 Tax=unclassified Streptomyces TaxID=2593676 RepID=UPI0033D5BF88
MYRLRTTRSVRQTEIPASSKRRRVARPVAGCAVLLTAVLLTGCGGADSTADAHHGSHGSSHSSTATGTHGHGMDDMEMGDPSATPAHKMPGAEVVKGAFGLLDTRPPGMDRVEGTAWLAQGPKGTTVTVSLTGLKPGASYMAHLHAQHCSAEGGGAHFQFDKNGSDTPPNEVHLAFTADKSGMGMTTVNNARKTGKDAVSVVLHPSEAMDNRIACADFDF